MRFLTVLITAISIAGCSVTPRQACQDWIEKGEIRSSLERCVSCASKRKAGDIHSVRRCAFQGDLGDIRDEL
ncbi:MAG: hypothetical protein ACK5Y6_00455 [Pseudomonadota bacterium]|jgi:hypothetical protein